MTQSQPAPTFLLAQIESGQPVAYLHAMEEPPMVSFGLRQVSSASGFVSKMTLDRSLARVFRDEGEAQAVADDFNSVAENPRLTVIPA